VSSLPPDPLRDHDAPPRVLVEALREELIEPARIDDAYARFLRRRAVTPARFRGPRVVRYGALAVLMAVGTVYAATLIRPIAEANRPAEARPPAQSPAPRPPRVFPPRAATVLEEDASHQAEPPPAPPTPPLLPTAPVREQPSRSPAPVPTTEQWKRAAQGLRDGDYRSADAALKELTRTGTEADRESAQLVQAQVLLAQGREREATSLLKSLERSARAPSVRRKSVELLERLRNQSEARPDRSRGAPSVP